MYLKHLHLNFRGSSLEPHLRWRAPLDGDQVGRSVMNTSFRPISHSSRYEEYYIIVMRLLTRKPFSQPLRYAALERSERALRRNELRRCQAVLYFNAPSSVLASRQKFPVKTTKSSGRRRQIITAYQHTSQRECKQQDNYNEICISFARLRQLINYYLCIMRGKTGSLFVQQTLLYISSTSNRTFFVKHLTAALDKQLKGKEILRPFLEQKPFLLFGTHSMKTRNTCLGNQILERPINFPHHEEIINQSRC